MQGSLAASTHAFRRGYGPRPPHGHVAAPTIARGATARTCIQTWGPWNEEDGKERWSERRLQAGRAINAPEYAAI